MADYTNNYKYIAEAWIENGEEEGFKTAFLASLFKQWQGHSDDERNPKFNADMVDGMHYYQISQEISDAVANTVKNFYLGTTYFGGEENKHYIIGTEAVHLYPELANMNGELPSGFNDYESYVESFAFPWASDNDYQYPGQALNLEDNPTIYDVLKELYYRLDDKKVDEVDLANNYYDKQYINRQFNQFHITEDGVDASSVNGLRFFVITQADYEALPAADRKNIHNVFIIKEQEDITAYYESIGENGTVYDGNPDIAPWNRAYTFKVDYATYQGEQQLCLMYKINGEPDTAWKIIAKASDFIDPNVLKELMREVVPADSKDHFINANYTVNPNNNDDYEEIINFPTTKIYDKRYISGAYFPSYLYNSNNNQITESSYENKQTVPIVTESNGTQFLDFAKTTNGQNILTSLKDAFDNKINNINTTLNNLIGTKNDTALQNTIFGRLKKTENNITTNANSINNLKGGNTSYTVLQAETDIQDLTTHMTELDALIEDNEKFDILPFNKYKDEYIDFKGTLFGFSNVGSVFVKRQGICYVYFYMVGKNKFIYKVTDDKPNYIQISTEKIPEEYYPLGEPGETNLFIPVRSWNSGLLGVIQIYDGHIYYGNTVPGQPSNNFNILATYSYPCKGFVGRVDGSCYTEQIPQNLNFNTW